MLVPKIEQAKITPKTGKIVSAFIIGPDTKEMILTSLHPGARLDQVRAQTGWELRVASRLERTEPPSAGELRVLREELAASPPPASG